MEYSNGSSGSPGLQRLPRSPGGGTKSIPHFRISCGTKGGKWLGTNGNHYNQYAARQLLLIICVYIEAFGCTSDHNILGHPTGEELEETMKKLKYRILKKKGKSNSPDGKWRGEKADEQK
jgi:hypothetical protein